MLMIAVLMLFSGSTVAHAQSRVLVVSSNGDYATLTEALTAAEDGDVIELYAGVHDGPFTIDKSVSIVGYDWPVIDGGGNGTVLELTTSDIWLQGLVVRNSGSILDEENSGIAGTGERIRIENNRLEDTLFGIYLTESPDSVIRGNEISSKDLDLPRRGDPIRVWYSDNTIIEDNLVTRGRDVVLWFSEGLLVRNNEVSEGRYGLHFMYCDNAFIENNLLLHNSTGVFLMYSRNLQFIHNTIAYNHGPSGYGIGLKDVDDARVRENLFFKNRLGVHLDNSPREVDSEGLFEGNVFAYNDVGVSLMPSVRNNVFTQNSFIENQEQVGLAGGGGQATANMWSVEERGNYWSDYAGYDEAADGIGDAPYRADHLFENLIDRYPNLRLFTYSPVTQAINFAAKAVPIIKPKPKLVDDFPLMSPYFPTGMPLLPQTADNYLIASSIILLSFALGMLVAFRIPGKLKKVRSKPVLDGGDLVIQVNHVSKYFDEKAAVNDLSFEVQTGEAIALWGANGAGKTTVLHCLLGLMSFEGDIQVGGLDVNKHGKEIRQLIGFVPQAINFHDDMTGFETIEFYAALKKISLSPKIKLLEQMGIVGDMEKLVAELSGGMKQRLALAIALLSEPDIIVLDEPTSNLDIRGRDDLLVLLEGLKKSGKTLIFSSHQLEEVMSLADRVLVMEQGKLIIDCPPAELHNSAGWKARLRLHLTESSIEEALQILKNEGFLAHPNGKGIWVQVIPGQKGLPISALAKAGIHVNDFEFDHYNEEH